MKFNLFKVILIILTVIAYSCNKSNYRNPVNQLKFSNKEQFSLFDSTRNRIIPVSIYFGNNDKYLNKLIIVNHGYGFNQPDSYLQYTYLCDSLSHLGFDVASIQHELSTDSLLPLEGNPRELRMPFWKNGAKNIYLLIEHLKSELQEDFYEEIYLIGHSNGGDMSVLFPQIYPGKISKIVSLDHRRMPVTPDSSYSVLSLRSYDQQADSGVFPEPEICEKYHIQIIPLNEVSHNEMDDTGSPVQKKQIRDVIIPYLLSE